MRPIVTLAVTLVLTVATSAQQGSSRDVALPAVSGTAVISGTVVNAISGQPVRRAIVTTSASEGGLRVIAVTGDDGRFAVRDLPAGHYYLGVSRYGFVGAAYGSTKPGRPGTTIPIAAGEKKSDISLRLTPTGAITGTVVDQSGDPVAGARVIVLHYGFGYQTGERTLMQTGVPFGTVTDDRGIYRASGLPPDDYYVAVAADSTRGAEMREVTSAEVSWAAKVLQSKGASSDSPAPPLGRTVDYAPVYYPGGFTSATATAIHLKAAEEQTGIDVVLDRVATARLTGTVVAPDGVLPPGLQVNVVANDTVSGLPFAGLNTARLDKDGVFTSAGLLPGDYTVVVRAAGAGRGGSSVPAAALFGLADVSINGGDAAVTVTLENGATVAGRLVFDGQIAKPPSDLSRLRVSLTASRSARTPSLGVAATSVGSSGDFAFVGVTPGRYALFTSAPGWVLKSAIVNGHDVLDQPLEVGTAGVTGMTVTFTDQHTEISGSFLDTNGRPAPEYFIIAFPADKALWWPESRRIQSQRPAADGHFSIKDLPAGEYLLAAVTDVEPMEWLDPNFLSQLVPAATKLTLHDGEKITQSLKVAK